MSARPLDQYPPEVQPVAYCTAQWGRCRLRAKWHVVVETCDRAHPEREHDFFEYLFCNGHAHRPGRSTRSRSVTVEPFVAGVTETGFSFGTSRVRNGEYVMHWTEADVAQWRREKERTVPVGPLAGEPAASPTDGHSRSGR